MLLYLHNIQTLNIKYELFYIVSYIIYKYKNAYIKRIHLLSNEYENNILHTCTYRIRT